MYSALQHVYVTAHGNWFQGPWQGETAQFGLRMTFEGSLPERGAFFTPGTNGNVAVDSGSQAGTNGTLTRAWTSRIGPVGSSDDCGPGLQIDFAEDLRTFLDAIKAYTSSNFRWTHVKVAPIGLNGRAEGNSSIYTFTSPVTGTAANHLPPQVAYAVSLRAPVIGRRGRGRFYLPAFAAASSTADGTIASAAATAIRSAAVTLIGNLENPPGAPEYQPVVVIMSASSDTAIRPTQVRTGDRFDTIRSRREQVAETYTSTDLT